MGKVLRPERGDLEVFLEAEGQTGVREQFFQTVEALYREEDREGNRWLVIGFVEGGKVRAVLRGPLLWSEPERH